jgi:hypothetical protein
MQLKNADGSIDEVWQQFQEDLRVDGIVCGHEDGVERCVPKMVQ